MKKILILSLFIALGSLAPTAFSTPAHAQVNNHNAVPLVVVRFNQTRVYFKRPMANAVQRALQISSDVNFKVVHYTPEGSRQTQEKAARNLQSVLKHLYGLGVRQGNVKVQNKTTAGLGHSEVHLYAR